VHAELGGLLDDRGIQLARSLVGEYCTALDMRGFSITLLAADQEILRLYDAPVRTAALHW
ncbi:dihydroxyacetone kinase, partial [Streptomyces sp. SID8455]|nr:dihydroxyacetone kinase [Streptomyces sp. SID8455]